MTEPLIAISNQPLGDESKLKPLDSSQLRIRKNPTLRPVTWQNDPTLGLRSVGTDHMLTVHWNIERGWSKAEIGPYENLSIPPTASCLHYATQCFEGLKLYRGHDGALRFFRPDRNCQRLVSSASHVALPAFDPKELERLLIALAGIEGPRWLPPATCRGRSLYVRPAMIADAPQIGVRLPEEVLLFAIIVPWPELPPSALKDGLQLITSRADSVRAWPGGFGSAKVGANYGPSFVALGEARKLGFDQVLWLFGDAGIVTEAGASNFFVIWRTREGVVQLVTAPLDDRVILPGVTRDSVLTLARNRLANIIAPSHSSEPLEVLERPFQMAEIEEAEGEGRLIEAFVSGTAYFITPVSRVHWRGKDVHIPMTNDSRSTYAELFRKWLLEIMYGVVQDPWGVIVPEAAQDL